MINRITNFALIILMLMATGGCSVVRIVQTQAGVAVEKLPIKSDERKTKISKRDFRLGFTSRQNQLGLTLEYRPYYDLERRESVTYKAADGFNGLELVLGITEASLLGWAIFSNLVETGEVAVNDDGELYNKREFDWEGTTSLQKGIIAATLLDMLIYYTFSNGYETTVQEPWNKRGEVSGEWEYMRNQPYRIELPTYNYGKDYLSETGRENVQLTNFLSGINNPIRFRDIDSIGIRALTEFEGKSYQKDVNLTTQAQLQAFHDIVLFALDIDMVTVGEPRLMPRPEVSMRWSQTSVQAGNVATLRVTIKNTGKGDLYRFTARTVSSYAEFNNKELKFGRILPSKSITVPISFEIDKLTHTKDIPISFKFAEYNDHTPEFIQTTLQVTEIPRPKFDYAYRIIDGGTDTSVGNGDGIFQRGESADVLVTVHNSGRGNASGVIARLGLPDITGVDLYGNSVANLQTLEPGVSKTATFNVGVKRAASINRLRLNLTVIENNFGKETELTEILNLPIGQKAAPKIRNLDVVAAVTTNSAQVFSGASYKTPISAKISQNSRVNVSGQLGEWYRVELNERNQKLKGWVHQTQLTTTRTTEQQRTETTTPEIVEIYQNTPPTLALSEPDKRRLVVEDPTMRLQGTAVANIGINKVELTVNGRTSNILRKPTSTSQNPTAFKIDQNIILNYGLNTIKLSAYDSRNRSSETITLNVTREREEIRNDYALLFAVNSYEHFDPWHKLINPIPDAEAIQNELRNKYGFAVELVKDPSRDDILTKINEYARKQYNRNDQLLIFFAGHGYYEETNNIGIGYLVARDTLPPDADPGKSSYISHGDFRERIDNIGCEHIFMIVDACFSGALDPSIDRFVRARGPKRIPDDVTKNQYIKQTLVYKTRWFLTSGGKEYVSDGRPNQHSPFTRRVLDALRSTGGGKYGILTLEDIGRSVEKAIPKPRAGEFGTNAPGSNFLFIRK